ncbi:unnamed protein product [Clonostachys rosea]|uniref:Peptidase A2 domain-containing protein n=1 Tax=Bionectria ochroleuca TaxID=29856 RepID=A0ABY6UGU5_BIOOC|nr:unnamed protein product [Clonostachys rosea]
MDAIKIIVFFGLMGGALALPKSSVKENHTKINYPTNAGCGEVNVFYTGFPAHHQMVIDQGANITAVDISLRNEAAKLVKAGFNLYVLFQGPDQPVSNIADRMAGTHWGVDAVGWGQRGYRNPEVTYRFEDNLHQYRESAPLTPTVFNWGPETFAEAVTRRVPLNEDCADKPGKLLGYEEICDPEICEKITVVLNGSLEDLLKGPDA